MNIDGEMSNRKNNIYVWITKKRILLIFRKLDIGLSFFYSKNYNTDCSSLSSHSLRSAEITTGIESSSLEL